MVWSKLLKCFPGRRRQKPKEVDSDSSDESDIFNNKQKAKAVAIVLSGYDAEIAAASIGPPCDSDTVERWVKQYRPPFFKNGMKCPPALILWWMNEQDRKEAEFVDAAEEIATPAPVSAGSSGPSEAGTSGVVEIEYEVQKPPSSVDPSTSAAADIDTVAAGTKDNDFPELSTSVAAEILSSGSG